VRTVIATTDRHAWALDDMLREVRRVVPSADFSTVFRAMQTLERTGLLQQVDIGDGKARYELQGEHHEHIRCIECGEIAEVPGCVVEDATRDVQRRTGYSVRSHHVVFAGICRACRRAAREERARARGTRSRAIQTG